MPQHSQDWINQLQREDEEIKRIARAEESISEEPNSNLKKAVLGITPRYIVMEKRLEEIDSAMARYLKHKRKINVEWVEERNEILDYLEERNK